MKTIRYAYYGLGKSNTYLALRKHLLEQGYVLQDDETMVHEAQGVTAKLLPCKDIDALRDSLKQHGCDYALVPIVNSDSGVVSFASRMMFQENFELVGILKDKIRLSLYALSPIQDFGSVKGIISNLPALSQCSHFVNKYMPFATFIKASSTTEAVETMIAKGDPGFVCIANQTAETHDGIVKITSDAANKDIVSNGGETETKYLLIKRREKQIVKGTSLEKILPRYYVYQSRSSQHSKNSVSPASLRIVHIKKDHKRFSIRGYLFGFRCEELCASNVTAYQKEGDTISFFYEYDNKHEEKTVNGLAKITFHIPNHLKNGRMSGIYCGYGNGKAGTLEFLRITKEEFDLYMEDFYNVK